MSRAAFSELTVDLSEVPEGWWVYGLFHNHTPIKNRGDVHVPFSESGHGDDWTCKLQHVEGGRLTEGSGRTPAEALIDAAREVAVGEITGRWSPSRKQRG